METMEFDPLYQIDHFLFPVDKTLLSNNVQTLIEDLKKAGLFPEIPGISGVEEAQEEQEEASEEEEEDDGGKVLYVFVTPDDLNTLMKKSGSKEGSGLSVMKSKKKFTKTPRHLNHEEHEKGKLYYKGLTKKKPSEGNFEFKPDGEDYDEPEVFTAPVVKGPDGHLVINEFQKLLFKQLQNTIKFLGIQVVEELNEDT